MKIVERSPGKFILYWEVGRNTSGRQSNKTETFKGSLQDAELRWRDVQASIEQMEIRAPSSGSVADLAAQYVAEQSLVWTSKTLIRNLMLLREHILPTVGSVQVKKLTRADCRRLVSDLVAVGRPHTADDVRGLLSQVCHYAIAIRLISANPFKGMPQPRLDGDEIGGWTDAEASRFLTAVFGHRLYPLYALALATGMRMGELLDLAWEDVDLEGSVISVRRHTGRTGSGAGAATGRGARRVDLGPVAIRMLASHRERLVKERRVLKVRASDLVFPSLAGTPLRQQSVLRNFRLMIRVADVPPIALHNLRSTNADHLLATGVSPGVVSERLGHRLPLAVQIDADVLSEMRREAAKRSDDFFFSQPTK